MSLANIEKIPNELNDFRKYIELFYKKPRNIKLREWISLSNKYLTYYSTLYDKWFPRAKNLSTEYIVGQIFKQQIKTKDSKTFYKCDMYAFIESFKRVNEKILEMKRGRKYKELDGYIKNFREMIIEGIEYLNYLSVHTEGKSRNYGIWKTTRLTSKELFDASIMLWIGDRHPFRIGFSSITPTSVMVLRQAIEVRLRNALGIHGIQCQNGRNKKLPQKFFFEFIKRHSDKIELPVELSIIEKIFDWTQTYVHGGVLKRTWEVELAFHLISPLFATEHYPNGGGHYLGKVKVKKELIDQIDNEINKLLESYESKRGTKSPFEPCLIQKISEPDATIL